MYKNFIRVVQSVKVFTIELNINRRRIIAIMIYQI